MFAVQLIDQKLVVNQEVDGRILSDADSGVVWLHLNGDLEESRKWLSTNMDMDQITGNVLCDQLTRPRLFVNSHDELLLNFRSVTFDEYGTMEMASVRAWVSERCLITLSRVDVPALPVVAERMCSLGRVVKSPSQVLWKICDQVFVQLASYVTELDERLDEFEDRWDEDRQIDIGELHQCKRDILHVRRYLAPQMEAFTRLGNEFEEMWASGKQKSLAVSRWRELVNGIKRDIETLTELRERVNNLHDALRQRTNEKATSIMYLLSVVATFFLPLTFVASLLGMNVSGMPGHQHPLAFWFVCGFMLVVCLLQWLLFKRWHWLK